MIQFTVTPLLKTHSKNSLDALLCRSRLKKNLTLFFFVIYPHPSASWKDGKLHIKVKLSFSFVNADR